MADQLAGLDRADDRAVRADDWTGKVAGTVEKAVGTVRDKTTVPLTKLAQLIVFGIILGVVALAAGVLVVIVLVRVIDVYLPFHPHARQVWVTYAGLGAIFLLAGAFCMRKKVVRSS